MIKNAQYWTIDICLLRSYDNKQLMAHGWHSEDVQDVVALHATDDYVNMSNMPSIHTYCLPHSWLGVLDTGQGAKLKKKKLTNTNRGKKIAWKAKEKGGKGGGGRGREREKKTESMIGARARRRQWRWNNYKGGQSIRFPQRNTDV